MYNQAPLLNIIIAKCINHLRNQIRRSGQNILMADCQNNEYLIGNGSTSLQTLTAAVWVC